MSPHHCSEFQTHCHPCLPCSALHGSHYLSREVTGSAKLALEKQTSQLSLHGNGTVYAQCTSVAISCTNKME